jgi:O-antigen/teichoic acid export membrane protein
VVNRPEQKRSRTHTVMYDGLYTLGVRLINMGCAAGLGILTARLLGPAGKGLLALPGVEAALIVSAFRGLNGATSYFMLNRPVGGRVLLPAAIVSLVFVALGAIAVVPIAFLAKEHWAAIPAIIWLPCQAVVNLASGYAIGLKNVRYSTTITVVNTVVTLAFVGTALFFIQRSPFVAIGAWLAANVVVAAIALASMVLHARRFRGEQSVGVLEFARFSGKVGVVNLVSLLNYRADLYIVAVMTSPATLGLYTVAVSAAESLLVPTQVASLVTTPHIGSLERTAAARLAARCVRNNLIVAFFVCGALFALAHTIVSLVYGVSFIPSVLPLRILLVGVFALSLSSPLSTYFTIKLGRPEIALWLAAVSAALCIGTAVLLVPRVGMVGAAAASTLAYILGQAAAIVYFHNTARISMREMLLPTRDDLAVYMAFVRRVASDIRRLVRTPLLRGSSPTPADPASKIQ